MTRPTGRAAVEQALIDATVELIVEDGLHVSVRAIADRASVNHGLIHQYFGSKQQLLDRAVDEVNLRASEAIGPTGFPRPDLASKRDGELAKALARIRLDANANLFSSHPITSSWRAALLDAEPDLTDDEVAVTIASASALGLGWALFADHLSELLELDPIQRELVTKKIHETVAELGGLPD